VNENNGSGTNVMDVIAHTLEANTSRSAFGEPVQVGDVTVIAAARVTGRGGGGGGGGRAAGQAKRGEAASAGAAEHTGEGSGGGLVQSARPVGALVIKNGGVSWRPAIDLNRIILGGQIVAVVALLVARDVLTRRRRRR
jgi:uncharacterized spore protein YtfJ